MTILLLSPLAVGCSSKAAPNPAAGVEPASPTPVETASGPAGTQLAAVSDATGTAHALLTATRAAIATATAGPALGGPNVPPGWNLIVYEPFADDARKWPSGPDDANPSVHLEREISGGQYVVAAVARQGFSSYVYPQMPDVLDFYAAVDGRLLTGDQAAQYGLVAALDPASGDYYAFLVSERGLWAFSLHQDNQWSVIKAGRSGSLSAGGNRLAVLCRRNEFTFYVNTQPVVTAHDDRLGAPGKIGLLVEQDGPGGSESTITFDNFTVLTP